MVMGNYASKLFHNNDNQKGNNETRIAQQVTIQDNSMCTPILPERKVLIDPRSISAGITRTPIEVKCTPVGVINKVPSAIPKYLQKKQFLETDIDVVMPPLTPKKHLPKLTDTCQSSESDKSQNYSTPDVSVLKNLKPITSIDKERHQILGLDPRSPAANFDRTPILIPKSFALMKARSQENLSRRGSYERDIYNPRNSYRNINTSFSIPEIQLLPDITSKASEGLKKLNTEKPNDSHISNLFQANSNSSISESEKEVTVIKNPKFENAKEKSLISEQTIAADEKEDEDDADELDECKDVDHSMKITQINDDKIKVWHDSEENVLDEEQEKDFVEKLQRKPSLREDVIITFDECAANTSLFKPTKVKEECQTKEDAEGRKKKSIKVDVKSISCERKTFTPENKHEALKNRTPLGNRSNDGQIQKIPSKSPQQLLRNKTASIRTEQENTPPFKKYNAKGKCEIQWDPNSTVFI